MLIKNSWYNTFDMLEQQFEPAWAPPQPKTLKETVFAVQDLFDVCSEHPTRLVGLPAYHLKTIAQIRSNWTPESLLFIAGYSKDQFIPLCRKFDENLVKEECVDLCISDPDRQERIAQAISQAIFRSNLDINEVLKEILDPWRTIISNRVNNYTQGIEHFTGLKAESLFSNE